MRMCCNMLEVIRLREELIQRLHETAILKEVYKIQCKMSEKSFRLDSDSLMFSV